MKILKEAINSPQDYKKAYKLIAEESEQNLKKNILLGKSSKSKEVIDVLTEIAKAVASGDQKFPQGRLGFLTRNMPVLKDRNSSIYIDFKALANDSELNVLCLLGLISTVLYSNVLNSEAYKRFLSIFSKNMNFDDLSYVLLGEFTEAFDVDNITTSNKFIVKYLNTVYFERDDNLNRKTFEEVYNSYVNGYDFNPSQVLRRLSGHTDMNTGRLNSNEIRRTSSRPRHNSTR